MAATVRITGSFTVSSLKKSSSLLSDQVMLRQITYISTAQPSALDNLLPKIEGHSQRANALNGLTGLLMFDGVRFLQVLEGPPDAVQSTFERIAKDRRHFALVMLRDHEIVQRAFGGWAMLCRDVAADDIRLAEIIAPFVRDTDKSTRALFESFASIRDKRAA
jgi:hypothetical protein